MPLMELLKQGRDGGLVGALAKSYGIPPAQTEAALGVVVGELSRGIERNTLSRGGTSDLMRLLGRSSALASSDPARLASGETQRLGIDVLEQLLGGKDRSRAVAARAAAASGLTDSLIKQMLPYIAAMVMGAIAKGASGGIGDILGRIPGLGGAAPQAQRPMASPAGGSGSLPLPGQTRTGTGDLLPLPSGPPSAQGGSVPYDDIADAVRQRGGAGGASVLRDLLGSLLGFSTKGGLMGWVFRLLVLRYGWSILQWTLRRMVLGR
jgi:hypothetical protein